MKTKNIVAETPKVAQTVLETKTKTTPPMERKYELLEAFKGTANTFRGKQRQSTFNALQKVEVPSTPAEVAALSEGLITKFKVEESVSYHLHHLVKDGFARVTNPTIDVAQDPTISE
jgi:hypothetical protein